MEMITTPLGKCLPMLPDNAGEQIESDIWIRPLNLSPYEAGKLQTSSTKFRNPVFERIKNFGFEVKMPRLFDMLEITVQTTREQSIMLMAVLAHSREISLAHRIVLPSEQIMEIILWNVFVAGTKNEPHFDKQTNTVQSFVKIELYATDNSSITDGLNGRELRFENCDQNFKLSHPLLRLQTVVDQIKERERSGVRKIGLKPAKMLPYNGEGD